MSLEAIGTLGGFDFTILYEDYDRSRFLWSIFDTVVISIVCLVLSVVLGFLLALLYTANRSISKALIGGYALQGLTRILETKYRLAEHK